MTESYDPSNPHHQTIRLGIEAGSGVSSMVSVPTALAAMRSAGFNLTQHEDLAARKDSIPWWYPIAGDFKYMGSIWDFFTILRMTKGARSVVNRMLGALEALGIAPGGTTKTAESLAGAADALVAGAQQNLFTPMYLMVGRKPGVGEVS
jgi:sterol 24-C-methyltransferase